MSLATSEPRRTEFLARFEHVCALLRRFQIHRGVCLTLLVAALGLAGLAAADFRWELPLAARAAGLVTCAAALVAAVCVQVIAPLWWWTKPRTAIEIENRFPQLGQRVRTVVQYAGLSDDLLHEAGAAPSLVGALERETDARAQPLPLDRIIPRRQVWAIAGLAAVPMLFLLIATARDVEWRIAVSRALLGRRPYTTFSVAPENVLVDRGESVAIKVELLGRAKRDVVLYTRPVGQADGGWNARALDAPRGGPAAKREATLENIEKPLDYRVTAGSSSSAIYRIKVRYPLAVQTFDVALQPPAYTGVQPSTVKGGDLRVIEGTDATFQIAFDTPPEEASLVFSDPSVHSAKDKAPPAPVVIPLKSNGANFTAGLKLKKGLTYEIQARTADGRLAPRNRYKIEVLLDRAPRVAFEQPSEALEVHPVAEVLNRIRVGDDFGLSKAGIVFQFNNGDEQTLTLKDWKDEPAASRTAGMLEERLLLEKLAASPTDSLTYYAFAEDNYPGGPRRTETDLRYLDIRPFKREYKLGESGDGIEAEGELTTLAELIARQRFNLNRATRLAKHKAGERTFVEDALKIAGFEETLVGMTREVTSGVEGIIGERVEPLHAAEEAMLAAIAALDHDQNGRAPGHMGEALRQLILARNTLRIGIAQDDAAARQAMRAFDRMQAQKIRKPKKDQDEAEEIAERIEQLARDEEFVYETLGAISTDQQKGQQKNDEKTVAGNDDKSDEPNENKRREATERQAQIADKLRELDEKLKKLETASDLAKARMANATETAEKASGALARGNTLEATQNARMAAAKLHELARQLKGELAREVAAEVAMARDLAEELAAREAELGQMPPEAGSPSASSGDKQRGTAPAQAGERKQGDSGRGGVMTEREQLERSEEAARTLEQWLKDASLSAQGDSAERIRELIEGSDAMQVVDRMQRISEVYLRGQVVEARRDAQDFALRLEMLARKLDAVYRGIIAPELARLVDLDKRIAELMERLKNVKPGEETADLRRLADDLVRDLEKAGLSESAKLIADAVAVDTHVLVNGRATLRVTLSSISTLLHRKIEDLILKDMVSARDEATPPAFKELVERYYEVLSRSSSSQ